MKEVAEKAVSEADLIVLEKEEQTERIVHRSITLAVCVLDKLDCNG